MKLAGKTAVVTGGGSGIGLGIAKALAGEGCRTVIGGRREDVLKTAAAECDGKEPVLYHACDVADRGSVNKFFAWAHEKLGRVDILVNAAGVNIKQRSMAEMPPEQWDYVMAVNATGVYNCLHAVIGPMRSRKDGLIVIINSISGRRAAPLGGVAYDASKFAASALGTAIGNEDRLNGIRITSIYPGEVDTPILEFRPQAVSAERRAAMLKPEDVAHVVVAVAQLPPHAHVPELIIKPTIAEYI